MRGCDRSIGQCGRSWKRAYGYCIGVGNKQNLSLTVSAAHVSPHPKTAAVQLAHARGKNFGESENWLRLYECMDGHACVFEACSVLREAHGPLLSEQRVEIREILTIM